MHHHHDAFATDACDRCYVAKEIEAELIIERGIDRVRRHSPGGACSHLRVPAPPFRCRCWCQHQVCFRQGTVGSAFPTAIDPMLLKNSAIWGGALFYSLAPSEASGDNTD